MRKSRIFLGLLVLATAVVLMGCASLFDGLLASKYDKPLDKEETVELYFDDQITVIALDADGSEIVGASSGSGFGISLAKTYKGKGSEKRPRLVMKIRAGERVIQAQWQRFTPVNIPAFNFVAGKKYVIKVISTLTEEAVLEKGIGNTMGSAFVSGMTGGDMKDMFMEFAIVEK
jgi:hypothetical protein